MFTVPRCAKSWLLERLKFEVSMVEEWFFFNSEFPCILLLSPASPSDWYLDRSILCSWKYYVGCFKTFRQFFIWNNECCLPRYSTINAIVMIGILLNIRKCFVGVTMVTIFPAVLFLRQPKQTRWRFTNWTMKICDTGIVNGSYEWTD